MALIIEHGWWVAGAVVLLLAATGFWILQGQRSRRWRVACIGLPGLAAVLIALALARPSVLWAPRAQRVVILLDLSGSTRASPWRNPEWVRDLAQRRLDETMQLTIVGFGGTGRPRVLLANAPLGPAAEGRWPTQWEATGSGESGAGSDLTAAMQWRSEAEARGEMPVAPRWVLTDGLIQGVQTLEKSGAAIGWTAIVPDEVDVGVLEVSVRAPVATAGVEVWTRIGATGKTAAVVQVSRDGQLLGQQQVSFVQAGTRWVQVHDPQSPADAAVCRYEVSVTRLPLADPWPENDRGSMIWSPQRATGRVLIIGSGESVGPLAAFQRRIVPAGQFPDNITGLLAEGWQVIVLNDVPLALEEGQAAPPGGALPPWSAAALDRFVRQTGGGMVILGRKHAFGPGHYLEGGAGPATLEGLSPVSSEQQDRPPARVLFVLDASGSMNESAGAHLPDQKFRIAARGVEQAIALLLDQDQVTLITFNDRARKIAQGTKTQLLSESDAADRLRTLLDEVRPTGNTVPDSALDAISAALGVQPTSEKALRMVVLLTDGEIPQMDEARWKRTLDQAGAALTIVAPSAADPATSPLRKLARDVNATWLATDDAGQWATLLKHAIARRISGSAVATPIPWRSSDLAGGPLSGLASEFIEVWKKPESREIVAGEREGIAWTLGAVAQRGLGKVAAITIGGSDAAYGQLLERVVQDVMPAPGDRRFTVTAQRDGETWLVTADGVDGQNFLDGEHLKLRVFGGGDSSQPGGQLSMPQVSAGRYQCRVEGTDGLMALIVRQGREGEELVARVEAGQVAMNEWPASCEFSPVVAPAGAVILPADSRISDHWKPHLHGRRVPLERWLWTGSAVLAVAALWLRRGPAGGRNRSWPRWR